MQKVLRDYEVFQFPNGLRLVHKQVTNSKIAHCGFVLDMGSRDETDAELGIAHFWEHMAFKGTSKRKSFHILNSLESVGGELNAYTTKEKVCFYASFLDNYYSKAVELLTDITFNSTFPEKEIEKERTVILEEMSMYLDAPDDAIADEFDAQVFQNHTLGNNILGTTESVKRFTKANFQQFIAQNTDTHRIIFASVGNFTLAEVLKMVSKHLIDIPEVHTVRERKPFTTYKPTSVQKKKPISQAHATIGCLAPAISDARRLPYFMLINLLGGPAMNTRLNMSLREKYGLVYAVEASYTPYIDTGMTSIYFGTEKQQLNRATDLVLKEIKKLQTDKLGIIQLKQTKDQLKGQLAMAEENNANLMLMLGKSLLDAEKIDSLDEVFQQIDAITSSQLLDLANELLQIDQMSTLTYLPE
jgi:predicted Zn-dependent peptidase